MKIPAEVQAIISAADAGHYATTINLVQRFLASNPDNMRAWLDLGQSLGHLARYDEAQQAFLKVIELSGDPPAAEMYGEIGNLYRAKGDFESAITWYQKQIDAQPADAMGHLYVGNVFMRQGKFEAAEAAFLQALTCEQVCLEEAHYSLGLVYRCWGKLSESKTHFEKAIAIDDQFTAAKTALKDVKSALALA